MHYCYIIPSTEFKLSCLLCNHQFLAKREKKSFMWLKLRNVEKKKICPFILLNKPRPLLSLGTPGLLINLPRNWLSQWNQREHNGVFVWTWHHIAQFFRGMHVRKFETSLFYLTDSFLVLLPESGWEFVRQLVFFKMWMRRPRSYIDFSLL